MQAMQEMDAEFTSRRPPLLFPQFKADIGSGSYLTQGSSQVRGIPICNVLFSDQPGIFVADGISCPFQHPIVRPSWLDGQQIWYTQFLDGAHSLTTPISGVTQLFN